MSENADGSGSNSGGGSGGNNSRNRRRWQVRDPSDELDGEFNDFYQEFVSSSADLFDLLNMTGGEGAPPSAADSARQRRSATGGGVSGVGGEDNESNDGAASGSGSGRIALRYMGGTTDDEEEDEDDDHLDEEEELDEEAAAALADFGGDEPDFVNILASAVAGFSASRAARMAAVVGSEDAGPGSSGGDPAAVGSGGAAGGSGASSSSTSTLSAALRSRNHRSYAEFVKLLAAASRSRSHGRYSSILEGLRSSNDIRQNEAASELAELLLMGNEETLPNIPIRDIVQQLVVLMQKEEHNLELTLTVVRCITNMQEALPRAMPILVEAVPTLLQKLKHIECIDIAEQSLIALEVMSRRNAKSILSAGGFADAVSHVDFFSMPSQRLVYQIAANCAPYIQNPDFALIKSCLPDLIQKMTFDDKRCCESICTFFYRLIENYRSNPERLRDIAGNDHEFLSKVQQLFVIQPLTINSTTFVNLLKSVRYMCMRCPDIAGAVIEKNFARTLRFLLIGNNREDATVDITLRPPQHTLEIIGLIGELLPTLPKTELFDISTSVFQYMHNSIPVTLGAGGALTVATSATPPPDANSGMTTVTWQRTDDAGNILDFSPRDAASLEQYRQNGVVERMVKIDNALCLVNLAQMTYRNPETGSGGTMDRRITSSTEGSEIDNENDAEKNRHSKALFELIQLLFPLLVDIGTETSCSNLRYEATCVMIRMVCAVSSDAQLRIILNNLALSSYLASTLSNSKGGLPVTVAALQLVHVLLEKLPHLYVPLFDAEGVFFNINRLMENKDEKKEESLSQQQTPVQTTKVINLRKGPVEVSTTPGASSSSAAGGGLNATPDTASTSSLDSLSSSVQVSAASIAASNVMANALQSSGLVLQPATPPCPMPPPLVSAGASSSSGGASSSNVAINMPTPSSQAYMQIIRSTGYPLFFGVPGDGSAGSSGVSIPASVSGTSVPASYFAGRYTPTLLHNSIVYQPGMPLDQNILNELTSYAIPSHGGHHGSSLSAAVKQAVRERIVRWITAQAEFIISTYYSSDGAYDRNESVATELAAVSALVASPEDVGTDPLKRLLRLVMDSEISAFQLNHSHIVASLIGYLTDRSPDRHPDRMNRIRRFGHVFMNLKIECIRPVDIKGETFAGFERLVSKLVNTVGQVEQFQIRIANLANMMNSSQAAVVASGATSTSSGPHLRGSQAMRFFQTHQIRCNLRRHPSCKHGRERGRSSIKVDPFTSISAIERYLIDRGVGRGTFSESSSDNDDGSDEDREELSPTESGAQAFSGRVEILINDRAVPSDLSILQAICEYSNAGGEEDAIPAAIWGPAHTLFFRVVPKNEVDSASKKTRSHKRKSGGSSRSSTSSVVFNTGHVASGKNLLKLLLDNKFEIDLEDPCIESVRLLRILYILNKYWYFLYEGDLPDTHEPILPTAAFQSSKLGNKVQRQLSDFLSVATKRIPKWTTTIVRAAPFLFSFPIRRTLLYCTAFGRDRALLHLVTEGNDEHEMEGTSRAFPRVDKRRQVVKRANLLEDAVVVMGQMAASKAQLEVSFDGEVGTGFGPTLEFYSAISRELQKHEHRLWYGHSQKLRFNDDGDEEVFTVDENGLFPLPTSKYSKDTLPPNSEARRKKLEFLGRLLGQALLDARMLDIPLSSVFYTWLLGDEITIGTRELEKVDPVIYNSLRSVLQIKDTNEMAAMSLNFTMPGNDHFELHKAGKDSPIKPSNVMDYISLVIYWRLMEGVREDMHAVRKGFEQIIDTEELKIFSPDELEELFCGCSEKANEDRVWSKQALHQSLRPDHGYTHDSPQVGWLVDMLHEFSLQDRRKFLQFCTGSPRLPVGGFRGLNPPLTVVRKTASYGSNDGELPSAMTCYNFLKIPAYTSYDLFVERFRVALQFIYSFHLT